MTTTAHEDQFTVGTQTIERVRAPYDTASILRRNVADLELALRTQTERAESAEAELAKARKQKPIKYIYRVTDCFGHDVLRDDPKGATILETIPLFAAPVPVPAVPSVVFMAHNKTSSILFAARKDADQYAASFGPAAGVSVTECAVIGSQSAPQASAVPAEWREVMSELAADVQAACDAEHPHRDQYPSVMRKYNNDMEIVEKARALLQSSKDSHYISCSCTTSCRLA